MCIYTANDIIKIKFSCHELTMSDLHVFNDTKTKRIKTKK